MRPEVVCDRFRYNRYNQLSLRQNLSEAVRRALQTVWGARCVFWCNQFHTYMTRLSNESDHMPLEVPSHSN